MFGKKAKLEKLDKSISTAQRSLDIEICRQEEELQVLSISTKDSGSEVIIAWMRQVMNTLPEVREQQHVSG